MVQYNEIKPMFSSDFGYLRLLDDIIKIANGWLMSGNYKEYYLALESWYLTIIERVQRHVDKNPKWGLRKEDQKKDSDITIIDNLKKIRGSARSLQHDVLTNFHEELERLTAKASLRLRDEKDLPGVAK